MCMNSVYIITIIIILILLLCFQKSISGYEKELKKFKTMDKCAQTTYFNLSKEDKLKVLNN